MNSYLTIKSTSEVVFKDHKSKFIAIAKPVRNEFEVKQVLNNIKSEYYDADHHCYAYRCLNKNFQIIEHWSDDGEPPNSAGIQIYYAIKKFELLNLLVVVVRYYGGIKLGIPGLINAYKSTALKALENAVKIEKQLTKFFIVSFSYEQIGKVMSCLKKNYAKIIEQNLDTDSKIVAEVPLENYNKIENELKSLNIKFYESH